PIQIIHRAQNILEQLEQESSQTNLPDQTNLFHDVTPPAFPTPTQHVILEEVRQMDLFSMTPLEALNRLADIKSRIVTPP
ncbi:MAG: hypothetical protein KC643_01480, partial [Nitrospira sp.]|nr:hypothetical protein [Nitrospira sp.]